jgi:hypothetical protein
VSRAPGWGSGLVGIALLVAFGTAMVLLSRVPGERTPTYRGLAPLVPEATRPGRSGLFYLDLPPGHTASLYRSPVTGGLLAEWPGGTPIAALGTGFFDGYADWELVRDPAGNEGWIGATFLGEGADQVTAPEPVAEEEYLSAVWWEGEIAFCVNPRGGPAGLDGDAFVALVERAADRWQELADGRLPLVSRGRCDADPDARGDGINTVGWVDDLGLIVAGQAWPNADRGPLSEIDIRLSRGYFTRLVARDRTKTLPTCVLSTLVHELGHLLGLDHPRSRALPSSMQAVGASRCDKGQPTASDRANLLRRYAPSP